MTATRSSHSGSGRRPVRATASLVAFALATGALSACVPLVIGGAATVGTLVAMDRRTSGAQLEDEGIELRAKSRIGQALVERAHINVASYNRRVLLTGEVPTAQDRLTAETVARQVPNVREVYNELAVLGNSTLPQRSADALVTGKVRASFVDEKDLSASAFRVVTERGTTYLMGRVTQREADLAVQITRTIAGVQKVVRLFEIITPEELRQIANQATGGSTIPATSVTPASVAPSAAVPSTATSGGAGTASGAPPSGVVVTPIAPQR